MDAWSLFDKAVAAPKASRSDLLHAVLAALDADLTGSPADRAELKAAVQCGLAGIGAASVESAMNAVDDATAHGRKGWPNYYLANAAVQVGDYELAQKCLEAIPQRFFTERDLAWRAVHSWELEAIAKLRLGDLQGARDFVYQVAGALATRGEVDDLASPRDLLLCILTEIEAGSQAARELLDILVNSIDVSIWFDSHMADRIRSELESRSGSDD